MREGADADLIAAVIGTHYGDRTGRSFTLASSADPEDGIPVRVYYYLGGIMNQRDDRAQYLDRLAVEVINAVNLLLELQEVASR